MAASAIRPAIRSTLPLHRCLTTTTARWCACNRLTNNSLNGMEVRGETLTTETVWDDTDIAHIVQE